MLEHAPVSTLLDEQKAFVERIESVRNADDLAAFLKDVTVWLHTPGVSNSVSPKGLDGAWARRLKDAPFVVANAEKDTLRKELTALSFNTSEKRSPATVAWFAS